MKRFLAICLVISLVLSMAACQATPENNIVQGKSLDKMIEDATKTQAPASSGAQSSSTQTGGTQGGRIADKIGSPKKFTDELTDGTGKVKIHVNADVEVPDATGVTVQRVEPAKFTQDQADILRKQLVKGDLFSGDDYKLSKSDIQKQILELQKIIAANGGSAGSQSPASSSSKNSKEVDLEIAEMTQQLTILQQQLKETPDTSTKTPITGQLAAFKDYSAGQKVYGLAQSDQNGYESFNLVNRDDGFGSKVDYTREKNGFSRTMGHFITKDMARAQESTGGHAYMSSADIAKIPDISISADQAKQKADALIAALGIKDMVCITEDKEYGGTEESTTGQPVYGVNNTFLNPRKCIWFLRYGRNVNNIPVTYTPLDCIKVENDQQSQPWQYEDMTFAIDDSGIVGFSWTSPYNCKEAVTKNSNLISFDKAMNVFNTMSLVVNAWDGYAKNNPDLTGMEITVKQIRLGLTRVTEQNKRNSGLLVPVWDFMGDFTYIFQNNGKTKTMAFVGAMEPILTVNAIDGSIISRNLGY